MKPTPEEIEQVKTANTPASSQAFIFGFLSLAIALSERNQLDLSRLAEILRDHIIRMERGPVGRLAASELHTIRNLLIKEMAEPDKANMN